MDLLDFGQVEEQLHHFHHPLVAATSSYSFTRPFYLDLSIECKASVVSNAFLRCLASYAALRSTPDLKMEEILIEKSPSSAPSFLTDNVISATISDAYSNLQLRRKALGLDNPGTVENINREVQREVLLSNYMFSGLRCDLQKMFSVSPVFRMQHGFAIGSPALPPWQMIVMYGTNRASIIELQNTTAS